MNERVLFVDDDVSLLSMLKRNFSLDFDVKTAENGPAALKLIEESKTFAAIMVDMRMPGMDGVELIKHARDISPDSVYIMLTGNQDLTTAIDAVNDGHVFRFLNKPCEIDSIRNALKAALRQHDLVTSQKELLNSTFTGAVGVLTEIIESMEAPLVDSSRVKQLAISMANNHKIEATWAMSLASRLMFVGVPLLPHSQREILMHDPITSEEHVGAVKQLLELSAQLIQKIPRLGPVTDVLTAAVRAEGEICRHDPHSQQFANLMLISFYAELLLQRREPKSTILTELIMRFDGLDTEITTTLEPELIDPVQDAMDAGLSTQVSKQKTNLAPEDLRTGMIVARHVYMESGALLVASGRTLTSAIIQRLRLLALEHPITVEIQPTDGSASVHQTVG